MRNPINLRSWLNFGLVLVLANGCAHRSDPQQWGGIPERPENAASGSDFVLAVRTMSANLREQTILHELRRGNVPDFLRHLKAVNLVAKDAQGTTHEGTVWVMPDYLAVGNDTNYVRTPMTPGTAQRVADHYGFVLPTKKLVDDIYRQAGIRLTPSPLPQSPQMVSVESFDRHNKIIEIQIGSSGRELLIAGHKKDLVLTNRLQEIRHRVAIYGWHRNDSDPIQPLSIVHGETYADYSHGVRLIFGMMRVDGELMPVAEVLQDPRLASLISEEGILRATRFATDCF